MLLAQTAQEKKLTLLYVGLFCFGLMMLVIDTQAGKRWVGDNKLLTKIIGVVFVIIIIVFIILYFVL